MIKMVDVMSLDKEKEQSKPHPCQYCMFYECELVKEYTQFRDYHLQNIDQLNEDTSLDDYSEMSPQCSIRCAYINQIECGTQNVTEGIGDHYKITVNRSGKVEKNTIDRWEPSQPVFISAQTGQGKNYFIENTLIPYVRDINHDNNTDYRVLIISNRLALKQQIKNHLNEDDENNRIYSYKEFADVVTYQGLLKKRNYLKKKLKRKQYLYVICDEAHFFTSDAMFNPDTQKILSTIVEVFRKAVRVYMSATPYDCLEYIIKYEKEGKKENKYNDMVFYHFKRDYSYLNIKTYSSVNDLYEEIVKSVKENREKWLLFIDDKKKCATVKTELIECDKKNKNPFVDENIFVVSANSKKDTVYQEIIMKEILNKNTYVLISTSVLDNGINLNNISHIVVSNMEKAKCLQMVGRARITNGDQKKTLYIKRFGVDEVRKQITRLKEQQDAYYEYELAYGKLPHTNSCKEYEFLNKYYNNKDKDWKNVKSWFGRPMNAPTELYLNEIAKSLVDRLVPRYEFILKEMEEEEKELQTDNQQHEQMEKRHIGQRYLDYQLSWFGKKYCVDDDITFRDKEKSKEEFINFLKSYANEEQIIMEENQEKFEENFTALHDKAFGRADKNKRRNYGIRKMNTILEEKKINYEICNSKIEGKTYWFVKEHNRGTEKLE